MQPHSSILLFVAYCCLRVRGLGSLSQGPQSIYCDETSPLVTKYFIPFFESLRPVLGCASPLEHDEQPLHVIKMDNDKKEIVLLTISDKGECSEGIILILISKYPVKWRLSIITKNPEALNADHTVVMSSGSEIAEKNFHIRHLQEIQGTIVNDEAIINLVHRHWGRFTTFSRMGMVHRISIAMPDADVMLDHFCDVKTTSKSPAVAAFYITKQEASGCYHAEVAGTSNTDVHVIDLKAAKNINTGTYKPTTVYLSLNPGRSNKAKKGISTSTNEAVTRDLILVLKSAEPVKWLLQSTGLVGNLTVISDGSDIENISLASSQRLKIVKQNLPNSFNSLWTSVLADTGTTPVSYIKIDLANVLTLVIPPRSKRGLAAIYNNEDLRSSKTEEHKKDFDDRSIIIPEKFSEYDNPNTSNEVYKLQKHLRQFLLTDCDQRETVAGFALSSIQDLNVSKMTLNDQNCQAESNSSHIYVKAMGTSCGSINYFSRHRTVLENSVHIFLKSGIKLRIPFNCRFDAGILGFPSFNSDKSEDDSDDYAVYLDEDNDNEEMYELHVYRVDSDKGLEEVLTKEYGQTAQLRLWDEIKVQTYFETRSFYNLALERCWLADHSSPDSERLAKENLWLIWNGCPANDNVTISNDGAKDPSFVFTINKEHRRMKQFFIFCLLGLCSPIRPSSTGNIATCPDSSTTCGPSSEHVEPVAQQLSRRGPFFVVNDGLYENEMDDYKELRNEDVDAVLHVVETLLPPIAVDDESFSSTVAPESPELRSSHVVMVGVPTEVAVALSIASFVIGAGLTGLLCCLHHHRKSSPKSDVRRNQELCSINAGEPNEGSELQSMIPTPLINRSVART